VSLTLRPKNECRWDLVALGEVMLRFDPGDRRIATTDHSPSPKAAASTTWNAG
jgi:hypothetical protein